MPQGAGTGAGKRTAPRRSRLENMPNSASALLSRLLGRRMTVVSGKGGVGKSTVVAAMACSLAAAGKRVLVVEVGTPHRLPGLLGAASVPPRGRGRIAPGIWCLLLDPVSAMNDFMLSQVKVKAVARRIVESHIYRRFIEAAPGLKELIMLGKVMMVYEGRHDVCGETDFDHILLDAPATGHGFQLLRVPQLVVDTFGAGPITREARHVQSMLLGKGTALDIVTLAEDMPVNEALELEKTARDILGMNVGQIIANAVFPAPDAELCRWLDADSPAMPPGMLSDMENAARWARARRALNEDYLARLHGAASAAVEELPFVFEVSERRVVQEVAHCIGHEALAAGGAA